MITEAEVLGVEGAEKHMAKILEKALEKKDPQKKLERRQKREKAVKVSSRSNEVAEKDESEPSPPIPANSHRRAGAGYRKLWSSV